MSAELLHLVVAALRPDAADADRERAADLARGLAAAEGVEACVVGRGESSLAAAVWIDRRDRIEGFAASPEHMRFVIEGVANATSGMWSASIALEGGAPPPAAGEARALWAFALPADPPAFEWEARELLSAVAALADASTAVHAGPTVEERERFRAGGVVLASPTDADALSRRVEAARGGWGALGERLVSVAVPVVV